MRYLITLFLLFSIVVGNYGVCSASSAKITVKVVGEDGQPVEGAEVGISFGAASYGKERERSVGFSDAGGLFQASAQSLDFAGYSAKKKGYYKSYAKYYFREGVKFFRWQPWNPTVELLLRKRENPVPMYARNTKWSELNIPVIGKEVGLDLIKFDWLPPYGKGVTADFIVKFESRFASMRDFDGKLTITFSNKFDGIQLHRENREYGSDFKLPRFAPETGYEEKFVKVIKGEAGKPINLGLADDNNYFFRVVLFHHLVAT